MFSFQLKLLPDGNIIIEADDENKPVYDYAESNTIRWIPEISINQEVQAGTLIESDHYSFTIVLNNRFNPHIRE